jgi:acyl carrier protein|tara:strand:+ start:219 stop:446 length:228 start_codon:yes stop_codon:yes gene_type:complete
MKTKIIELLSNKLGVDEEKILETSHIVDDLGADSLDAIELVMDVEKEFDITIADEEADKIETVQDIIDVVASKAN